MRAERGRNIIDLQDCFNRISGVFRLHGYYDLDDNPLLRAARKLNMGWLVNKFTQSLTLICSDRREIYEKRWVLDGIKYFNSSSDFNTDVCKIDLTKQCKCNTVKTFLRLIKSEILQEDIDWDTFHELMEFINSSICEDEKEDYVKARLYWGLMLYGLQRKRSKAITSTKLEDLAGEHSEAVTSTDPEGDKIMQSVMETIEPGWWYKVLNQAAIAFRICMGGGRDLGYRINIVD